MDIEQKFFDKFGQELTSHPAYILEGLLLEVTERICEEMEEQDISRSELAERLGVSRQYITNFLNTPSNTTLKTIVEMASALDLEVDVTLRPRTEAKDEEPRASSKTAG